MALPLRFLVLENYDRGLYYPRDMKVYLFFYICFGALCRAYLSCKQFFQLYFNMFRKPGKR